MVTTAAVQPSLFDVQAVADTPPVATILLVCYRMQDTIVESLQSALALSA